MNWYKRQLKIAMPGGGAKRGWTADELEQIKNLILQGKGLRSIAKMFGVTKNTISQLNKKYKWRETQAYRPPIEFSPQDLQNIKKMIDDGISIPKIADFYNVSKHTIYNLNKKYKWIDIDEEREKKDKLIANLYLLPPKGEGWTAAKIQERHGISLGGIKGALERLGLLDQYRSNPAAQKQKYIDNPELKEELSRIQKQRFIDNPELRRQMSQQMLDFWDRVGRLEGFLLSYPTREQAVSWLEKFKWRNYKNSPQRTMGAYNKYMKIIENHTYPDEVQQGVTV